MSNSFIPLTNKTPDSIANLIFSLPEGNGIWFSYDNHNGYNGTHDWVQKVVEGDEYVYKCDGDHHEGYLEKDEDVSRFAQQLSNDPNIRFYMIQPVPGYIKHPSEPDRDDQSVGEYETHDGPLYQPERQYESKNKTTMKQELLEYLIRSCAREVLSQMKLNEETEDIKGAAAPPADEQGTGDAPPIPDDEEGSSEDDKGENDKETPEPEQKNLKGIILVNPRDKGKLQKINVSGKDEAGLERSLYQLGSLLAGHNIKIALSTLRMVKNAAKNPEASTFLYIGKQEPDSEEIYLMADNSVQVAKDNSVDVNDLSAANPGTYHADDHTEDEPENLAKNYATRTAAFSDRAATSMEEPHDADVSEMVNENLKKLVKQVIVDIMYKK